MLGFPAQDRGTPSPSHQHSEKPSPGTISAISAVLLVEVPKPHLDLFVAIAGDIPGLRSQAVWCGNWKLANGETAMRARARKELH